MTASARLRYSILASRFGLLDFDPSPLAMTLQYGLAEHDLAMPVGKCRESRRSRKITCGDVTVERFEKLFERVGMALGVAARIVGDRSRGRAEQRRVAQQRLIGPVPLADPKFVRLLAVPSQRTAR